MPRILLDTNALIALSDPTDPLFGALEERLKGSASACTCSVAWHEYVRGPLLREDWARALRVIESRVLPLEQSHAEFAGELFNKTGRRRGSTADCLIAAVAVGYGAELLTHNLTDFRPFVSHGLRLIELPDQ